MLKFIVKNIFEIFNIKPFKLTNIEMFEQLHQRYKKEKYCFLETNSKNASYKDNF